MFENLTNSADEIKDNIENYLFKKTEYYKLLLFKKTTQYFVSFFRIILLGGLAFLILFFISFAVGYIIGQALENLSFGFLIIAGIYVVLFLFVLAFGRKLVERKVLRSASKVFFND